MARRYDSRTTIFSPEGRLYQVEYAMEAIGHAGTCLGILANDGILLAAERKNTNKLLDEVFHSEKIYHLHDNMACSVAGITSDANVLTNELRWMREWNFCSRWCFSIYSILGWSVRDTTINMENRCLASSWYPGYATSNRPTLNTEERGPSVFPSSTWDGTNNWDINFTSQIHLVSETIVITKILFIFSM